MGLLDRLKGEAPEEEGGPEKGSLAREAASMRTTLTGLHAERARAAGGHVSGQPDLRGLVRDLLEGEVEAPTGDIRWLISQHVDAGDFYAAEIAPNWDGLDELQRADKLDGFVDLALMVDASPDALPREMAAKVRTKVLILAWAFDEAHGFIGRLVAGSGG
ncbi:MAG: hypothetical protein QOD53_899 [Thermoleophilaceae bacterium]|nr:hypothetical protein [Thermoleophilaceae bacterium]